MMAYHLYNILYTYLCYVFVLIQNIHSLLGLVALSRSHTRPHLFLDHIYCISNSHTYYSPPSIPSNALTISRGIAASCFKSNLPEAITALRFNMVIVELLIVCPVLSMRSLPSRCKPKSISSTNLVVLEVSSCILCKR